MPSSGPREPARHEWPSAPAPEVREFEARLSRREALLRAGLADLEIQLAELQAQVAAGCVGAAERGILASAFEALRRELACIVSARQAVVSLLPEAERASLDVHRHAPAGPQTARLRNPGEAPT